MMTAAPHPVHAHSGHSPPSVSGQPPRWICSNGSSPPHPGQFPTGVMTVPFATADVRLGTLGETRPDLGMGEGVSRGCRTACRGTWGPVRRSVGDAAADELPFYPCVPEGACSLHAGL